ncbi:MAG: hypothetical protein ACM31J_04565 [Nitrososphaerales archaeon]
MKGRNVILDNLRYFDKLRVKQTDDFIKAKVAEDIIKFISIDQPIEMKEFCLKLKDQGYTNTAIIESAVYKLVEDRKIVYVKNKMNEEYFQRLY